MGTDHRDNTWRRREPRIQHVGVDDARPSRQRVERVPDRLDRGASMEAGRLGCLSRERQCPLHRIERVPQVGQVIGAATQLRRRAAETV